jgi:hypothetical protein
MISIKTYYRILFFSNNIIGLLFIGLSFLAGPGVSKESESYQTGSDFILHVLTYATTVCLIFTSISVLLSYLFRKKLFFSKLYFKKVFYYQFAFFLFAYILMISAVAINYYFVTSHNS